MVLSHTRKHMFESMADTAFVDKDDETDEEDTTIQWQNIIFLPFQPLFKLLILCVVIIKTTLGPMQAVFPIVYCDDTMDRTTVLFILKYWYMSFGDIFYGIDTFLHILHRQVTDMAMRREFLPKSGFLIMIDIISLVPFYRLISTDDCGPIQIWPNVLGLMEFITVYRIVEYFELSSSHCWWKVVGGFFLLCVVTISFITWCFIICTHTDSYFCSNCSYEVYDWRKEVARQINKTDTRYSTVIYAATFVMSFLFRFLFNNVNSTTIADFVISCFLMTAGFTVAVFVVFPKTFSESLLRLRRVCEVLPRMHRIIEETKRKNPSPQAHVDVRNFYNLMWKNRGGITSIPEVITELPRYLRLDISQDLLWPIFYHSPAFRRVSLNFQRWLGDNAHLDYKLPNENFFAGPHCRTHFIYLKSGIVQLISAEDGKTPLLSVTSGTIFGDVNFFVPPPSRKVIVQCLTYCEIFFFTRSDILRALQIFPEDRRNILLRVKDRIKHARTLHTCKQHIRGLDRAEDEGVAWVKRRWWELNDAISQWKKTSTKPEFVGELPPEEAVYHCSKYIGRLVLCPDPALQRKSMFARYQFPWILLPNSVFEVFWRRLVMCTVFLVLILHPLNIPKPVKPKYFVYFQSWTDFIYIADICVLLMTAIEKQGHMISDFASVLFTRFKSLYFILTLIATFWIEDLVVLVGMPEYYSICQFNRLIKIILLFSEEHDAKDINRDSYQEVFYKNALIHVSFIYVSGYFIYTIKDLIPNFTMHYFFANLTFCTDAPANVSCDPGVDIQQIAFTWAFRFLDQNRNPETLTDIYIDTTVYVLSFLIYVYCTSNVIGVIFLKYKGITDYLFFVSNITNHYLEYHIHPGLLARMHRYLLCHWKFYKGVEAADPNYLKNEPYDIYWKAHGEIAMNIIKDSRMFKGANPSLIKEIAYQSKFTILPKNATLLLFGVTMKKVSWLVNGLLKNEYLDESGELQTAVQGPGELLAFNSVFFEKESLFSTIALTECEILYLDRKQFYHILQRFPLEWSYIVSCTEKFKDVFDDLVKVNIRRQRKLKQAKEMKDKTSRIQAEEIGKKTKVRWNNPESTFIKYWMPVRAIEVTIAIFAVSFEGGGGADVRYMWWSIVSLCKIFTFFDMILQCFMGYYDQRDIAIYSKNKCMKHYLARGFLPDVISMCPWTTLIVGFSEGEYTENTGIFVDTLCQFARIYHVLGYFNYLADSPIVRVELILIIKWQVLLILIAIATNQYMMSKCVFFDWANETLDITALNSCWLPEHVDFDVKPTPSQMRSLFAESISITQSAFTRINLGLFRIDPTDYYLRAFLLSLGLFFWCVTCYSLTLLILTGRGTSLFQNAVTSLSRFLHAERLDDELIQRSLAHFSYWWKRTKSINIQNSMTRRVGVVFRQDLNYFFFKQTLTSLDTLLKGGEKMQRHLACIGIQYYFLPRWTIMREMDLTTWVYVVHRGKVAITQEGKTLAYLTKGSIFGHLNPSLPRPVRVTATTIDHVDIVQMPVKLFQDHITDEVRKNILNNPESALDYMQVKIPIKENPYNTVKYLLRGNKTIQLPWMQYPVEAHTHAWYNRWLALVWMAGPLLSAFIVLVLVALPPELIHQLMWALVALDLLHLAHFVSEFYTMRLEVIGNRCVNRHVKLKKFQEWGTYVDILSFVIPMMDMIEGTYVYQLGRLLRVRLFYDFHKHFCSNFKSNIIPGLMKFAIVCLILHALACGWIAIGCKTMKDRLYHRQLPPPLNATFYLEDWTNLEDRKEGCAKLTTVTIRNGDYLNDRYMVPIKWQHDYLVAMTFVLLHVTETDTSNIPILNLEQLYYKIFVTYVINLLDVWILSIAISAFYLEFREHFNYDYNVVKLLDYLKHIGLTDSLLNQVKEYTTLLWHRQGGSWLPELAQQAPQCLREDLLGTLYSHHLETLPLFRSLPSYFRRQLVARLHRIVVFSGKPIVQEGDIFACIYFIHEGDVEKWYTDSSGEKKMMSLLTTNGFFGLIPGLFPGLPFQFTYITRTVVDLVYLMFKDWQDLLDGYPKIKHDLYVAAKQLKAELRKTDR